MEKVDRKKLAKAALVAASLTLGLFSSSGLFNQAHASGTSQKYQAVGEDGVNYCYCNKTGSKCQCVT